MFCYGLLKLIDVICARQVLEAAPNLSGRK